MNREMKNQYIQSLERECELLYQLLQEINDEYQEKKIRTILVNLSKYLNQINKPVNY